MKLGQGGFGTVWRAVDRKTDQFVAVKQIDKLQSYWQGAKRAEIQLEIDILRACNHENITKLYNYYEESRTISIARGSVSLLCFCACAGQEQKGYQYGTFSKQYIRYTELGPFFFSYCLASSSSGTHHSLATPAYQGTSSNLLIIPRVCEVPSQRTPI